uniref:hypothetical protein n=2 Tax=Roseivirga sp. TaxID=1964215 RepID=UPI00404894E7
FLVMKRNGNSGIRYYMAEILILIFGISISFLLNEWRLNSQAKKEQIKLLEDFQANLRTDSLAISQIVKNLDIQQKASLTLLQLKADDVFSDSTTLNFLRTLSYSPFTPTQITYEQMKSLGASDLIENDSLAKQLVSLYEVSYKNVSEWTGIDGTHVKETLIPYTSQHMPFALYLNYSAMDANNKKRFMLELQKDELKYIMQFLLIYKASTKAVFDATAKSIAQLLQGIDQELRILD